jgi:hypothetical protein
MVLVRRSFIEKSRWSNSTEQIIESELTNGDKIFDNIRNYKNIIEMHFLRGSEKE